jgi:hypothetical protein
MNQNLIPARAENILSQLHEKDLDIPTLELINRVVGKRIKEMKVPQPIPSIDLNAPPQRISRINGGNDRLHPWHYQQGIFKLDFRRLWTMTLDDCQAPPNTKVGQWLELVGQSRSPNANLLDFLVDPKNLPLIPKNFCEEEYEEEGIKKNRKTEILFGGTAYLGKYPTSRRWIRSLYFTAERMDWGWVNLKESATARNYRIIAFSHEMV